MSDSDPISPSERAAAQLRVIGARALTSNLRRVEELTETVRSASPDHELSEPAREAARGLAHQLAGSAGTFGFERVSERARRLEHALMEQPFVDRPSRVAALAELEQMRGDLLSGPDDDLA